MGPSRAYEIELAEKIALASGAGLCQYVGLQGSVSTNCWGRSAVFGQVQEFATMGEALNGSTCPMPTMSVRPLLGGVVLVRGLNLRHRKTACA